MKKSLILVFGKDGQVGKAFQELLGNDPQVTWIGRAECDLSQTTQIQETLCQVWK